MNLGNRWITAVMVLVIALQAQDCLARTRGHSKHAPVKAGAAAAGAAKVAPTAAKTDTQAPRLPSVTDTPVADKWALIIGISKFRDSSLNLKFPAKDARDFYNYLVSEGNFAPDHVKLLLNEEASRGRILSTLGDKWLPRVANPNDLVLIYISSHGSPSNLDVGGVNYLVAYDTDKDSLFSTGIPMQDLTRIIKGRVHSDRIVLLLDACHSGAARPDGKAVFHQGNVNVDEIVQGTGQLVISSSAPDQVSWESKEQPNGVFTRYLIEGMRQGGSKTRLGEAYQYMKERVQEEVLRDRGVLQTPVLRSKWEGSELVLSAPPTKPRSALKEVDTDEPVPEPVRPVVAAAAAVTVKSTAAPAPAGNQSSGNQPSGFKTDLTLWQTYMSAAMKSRQAGRFAEAEKILCEAQKEAETFPQADPRRTETISELADIYVSEGRYSDAEPLYWRVLPELERSAAARPLPLSDTLTSLGRIMCTKGKLEDAGSMCKRALALKEKSAEAETASAARCLDVLALVDFQSANFASAEKMALRSLAIRDKLVNGDDRALADTARMVARALVAQERYADADAPCKRALEVTERAYGPNTAQTAECLDTYITTLNKLQRLPEARRFEYRLKLLKAKIGRPGSPRY